MTEITICRVFPTDPTDDIDRPEDHSPVEYVTLALAHPPPGATCGVVDFMPELFNYAPLRRSERTPGILLQPRSDEAPLLWPVVVQINPDHTTGTVWILDG